MRSLTRVLLTLVLAEPTHAFLLAGRTAHHAVKPVVPSARAAVSASALGDNLRATGAAVLASLILIASPNAALAKGGGHSSVSHSSSHSSTHASSRSSSSRSSSSRSSSVSSYRSSPSSSSRSSSSVPRSYTPSTSRPSTTRLGRSKSPSSSSRRSRSRSRSSSRTRSGAGSSGSGSSGSGSSGSDPYIEEEVHTTYRPRSRTRYNTVYYDSPAYSYTPPPSSVTAFPPSATEAAFHDGLWAGRIEALTVVGGAYLLYADGFATDEDEENYEGEDDARYARELYEAELRATRDVMDALKAEHAGTDPLVSAIQMPVSGKYEGRSAEDDGGDQGVVTHLTFKADGTVEGWGEDAEDGRYVIKDGVWSTTTGGGDEDGAVRTGGRVAWVEKYDEGFEVALRGQVLVDGTIRAMWASTIGVAGSVDLVKRR